MTITFDSLEDLRGAAGVDLGASRWFELTQERVDAFAVTTEDRQWIHVDPIRAAAGPFGGPIVHGFLTLSLVSAALEDVLQTPWAQAVVNYGLNKVRFPSAVPVGSRVRGTGRILEVDDVPGGVQLVTQVLIQRDGIDKPACVAESVIRVQE